MQLDIKIGIITKVNILKHIIFLKTNNVLKHKVLNNHIIYVHDQQDEIWRLLIKQSDQLKLNLWKLKVVCERPIENMLLWKNCLVTAHKSEFIINDEYDLYDAKLLNAKIYFHKKVIGNLIKIENHGAHNILRIKLLKKNSQNLLIPLVDDFIKKINVSKKKITLRKIK